ncbi:MAG: iron ABC transporter permease [Pirellulaceae bacterium]|nr:iron ABC transporter permease [Pirellulaceae bacterium]
MTLNSLFTTVGNTLLAIGLCLAIAIPLGLGLAMLIGRSDVCGRRWATICLASQLAVPLYVVAGGWSAGVGLQGWLRLADWLGPTGVGWMQGWLGSLLAVAIIHALAAVPGVCLILLLGLSTSDSSQEQVALLEGGPLTVVRHVWLPKIRVWIAVAAAWCGLGLLTEMVVSNLYMFPTVTEQVYLDFSRDTISPVTYVASVGLCMLPLLLAGLAIGRRLPALNDVLQRPQYFPAMTIALRHWRLPLSLLMWGTLLGLVGIPLLNLAIKAGWQPRTSPNGLVSYGWSGVRFWQTVVESVTLFRSEFYWSILLATASTLMAASVACSLYLLTSYLDNPVAESAAGGRRWTSRVIVHGIMLLLITIPGPLVGVLVTQSLNGSSWPWLGQLYSTTLIAPILAQQFRLLPVAWLMICGLVGSTARRTWELAGSDGLGSMATLRRVVWPHARRPALALGLLLALLSIGELSCSIGVLPPGVSTLSMRLFEILHFGMRHQDSGLCGILILLGWLSATVIARTVLRTPA